MVFAEAATASPVPYNPSSTSLVFSSASLGGPSHHRQQSSNSNSNSSQSDNSSQAQECLPKLLVYYTRRQILNLHASPLVQCPQGMPTLKDWFGDWSEQHAASQVKKDAVDSNGATGNRRFPCREQEEGDNTARPSFRSTLSQPSHIGNFKHQSLRSDLTRGDRDRGRDNELRDKQGHERLRSLSDMYDRDRDCLALPLTLPPLIRSRGEREAAPHVPSAVGGANSGTSGRKREGRDRSDLYEDRDRGGDRNREAGGRTGEGSGKTKGGESTDRRRGAEPPQGSKEDRQDGRSRERSPEVERCERDRNRRERERALILDTNLCLDGRITRLDVYPAGAGGFSDVYEGDFEGRKVAIKVARPFGSTGMKLGVEKLFRRFWREYKAWSRLCHPNILACLGYSYDFSPQSYRLPCLISPWMSNGTLFVYLQNHPEANRLKLLRGIAEGLAYLHSQQPRIVHGDLRAGNVLVSDQGVPYLADFGLSRVLEEICGMTTTSELAGSVRWMSPELLQADGKTTVQSDAWAFAMTILEVMTGERPYSSVKSDIVVLGMIRDGCLPSRPEDSGLRGVLDDYMWDGCQRCWAIDPRERPSMTEMVFITGVLQHASISDRLSQNFLTWPIDEVITELAGEAVLEPERLGHGVIVELRRLRQEIMELEKRHG